MLTNGSRTNGNVTNGRAVDDARVIELTLSIDDRELCEVLSGYEEGPERDAFAISALRIGAIALRQAQGRIDAEHIRHEGEIFIANMSNALESHQKEVTGQIAGCLKEYFDPESGRFSERVKSLIDDGGDLERAIRAQISGEGSELSKTLTSHVGKESPLMQSLDPKSTDGLIGLLSKSTEETLTDQRERILSEFSLDNGEGALSRLVTELKTSHGEVGEALQNRIGEVVGEFSLDREDSALSRLMTRVERAQGQISREFSLDEDGSALARMRKELLEVLKGQHEANTRFQEEVKVALAGMAARKKESERSTSHGLDFEEAVLTYVSHRSRQAGDVATHTANTTGHIRNNKKGDIVIRLGSEHAASGSQIVVEAKQDSSYKLDTALSELAEARKNRDAEIGIFVFSRRTAPEGLEAFTRDGSDVVVVWDSEDPESDVILDAGLSVAKALCVQGQGERDELGLDIEELRDSILEIERQSNSLQEITKSAGAIDGHVTKILDRARIVRNGLDRQVGILNGIVSNLQ